MGCRVCAGDECISANLAGAAEYKNVESRAVPSIAYHANLAVGIYVS